MDRAELLRRRRAQQQGAGARQQGAAAGQPAADRERPRRQAGDEAGNGNGEGRYYPPSLEAIRRDYKKMESARSRFWKPQRGENQLRILPPWSKKGFFYQPRPVHWNVGPTKRSIVCGSATEQPCFVCDRIEELTQSSSPRDQAEAERMAVSMRMLLNVVDLSDVEAGVQVWECTNQLLLRLIALMMDPDHGDFTHPERGYAVKFTKTGEGKGTKYGDLRTGKGTPVPYANWQGELKNLDRYVRVLDYEGQRRVYEGADEGDEG
jgi:hypothetical protein